MKSIYVCFLFVTVLVSFCVKAKESCEKALDSIPKFESSKKMFYDFFQFKAKFGQ
jgi:hypothetical protein